MGTRFTPLRAPGNLGAIEVQLTPEDLREIESSFIGLRVHGSRMNEEQMLYVDLTA
jgi:hypothetical protein